jgi:hypothetical protein
MKKLVLDLCAKVLAIEPAFAKSNPSLVAALTDDLIQVGNTYFVRDGHHRISVARPVVLTSQNLGATVLALDDLALQPEFTATVGAEGFGP